jgi:acyl carrier protein phosphodiesterase
VNLLDDDHQDNGFLSYWAEQAIEKGVDYIKQHLYIWSRLIPAIEQKLERELDLFNPDDTGIVDFWANRVEELMEQEGLDLETAIQRVIEMILQPEPTVYEELIPYIEQLLGVPFDENNPQHMGFLTYWSQRAVEEGLENIENLLQAMIDIKNEVEALIGQINFLDDDPADDGFITYWAQRASQEGTNKVKQLLQAMAQILDEVEALIGDINLLDNNPQDDGFLTYWAEYANDVGIDNVRELLSYMAELKPHLENLVGEIDLLDNDYDDNGLLTFWAQYAQQNGLQKTTNIIDNMVRIKDEVEALIGPVDLYDHQYGDNGFLTYWAEYALDVGIDRVEQLLNAMAEIKPEVENLIGEIDFFDNNYDDNGFLTSWAEYAISEGIQKTKDILSNMKAILENDWDGNGIPEIVELIGEINFFDHNYEDNGFLTYWAEKALTMGVGEINKTLYIWKRLLPYVEDNEGRELNLFDPNDSGIISYWEGEVRRLMQEENLSLEEAIQKVIDMLTGGTSTASFLYQTSEKVLNFFKDNVGIDPETGLPYSFITTTEDGIIRHDFFTPEFTALTDIAMQIVSLISLQKIGKMSQEELEAIIGQILDSIQSLPTYSPQEGEFEGKTYFFNYYTLPDKEVAFGNFISAVDNANMVMALILAREACPQHAQEINNLISKIDLKFFYDGSVHLFRGGYYYDSNSETITPADFHYGMLNTETRLISYLAIGKEDLSSDEAEQHWQVLSRTMKEVYGIDVLTSYGGSLFEALFPSLFVDEANLSQNGFGLNFKKALLIQKLQAIENGMPLWGESPAFDEIYEYSEFGSEAGINPYESRSIISPYSVFLTLNAGGKDGDYLRLLEALYPESLQSETGIVDAIDINNDLPVYLKSALVQGIVLASIANYLNGSIRNLFIQTEEAQRIIPFIQSENYFTQQEIDEELQTVHDMIENAITQNQWQRAKALFDYFKDLVITYNKQTDFPDLDDLNSAVQNLVAQNVTQLYQDAQEEINNQNFNQAIKDLLTVLYYQPDNQDAFDLLNLARQLRKEQIEIPEVTYLITDFEQGCRPNQYVSKIGPVNGPNGNIEVGIVEDDPNQGKVMKLKYELQPGGFNGIYINVDDLEFAKSGKLVFDIKGDDSIGIPEKVKIELHFEGSEWPYPAIEITGITSGWQHMEIDLSQFLPALPDEFQLEQIAIIFEGDKVGNNQGAIYIDNIGLL